MGVTGEFNQLMKSPSRSQVEPKDIGIWIHNLVQEDSMMNFLSFNPSTQLCKYRDKPNYNASQQVLFQISEASLHWMLFTPHIKVWLEFSMKEFEEK